jgi:hypothetical protein
MHFRYCLAIGVAFVLSACASNPPAEPPPVAVATPPTNVVVIEDPAPPPKVVKAPVSKAKNQCTRLPQLACINVVGCEWIKRESTTDKDGRPLMDFCQLKATVSTSN